MEKQSIQMTINGQKYEFLVGEKFGMIPPSENAGSDASQTTGTHRH